MTMTCKVCNDSNRLEIDRKLAQGVSLAAIARQHVGLSKDSLRHHRDKHISRQMAKHQEITERIHSGELLAEIDKCLEKCISIRDNANDRTSLAAMRELRETATFMFDLLFRSKELALRQAEVEGQGVQGYIDGGMTPKDAMRAYQEMIKDGRGGGRAGGNVVVYLPAKEPINSGEYPDPADEEEAEAAPVARQAGQRTRTKAPAAHEESINGPGILDWVPDLPPAKGW